MKIYGEYNILGHMQKALEKDFLFIESTKHRADYSALKKIWDSFIKNHLQLITCEDDCLMEFTNYDESIRSYQDVENYLTPYPHMIKKFELFKKIIHRGLMICPYGEYGFGRGPSGGGPPEYYELLDQIRTMLNKPKPTNDQKDRDARHIMHCILYGCDFFLTMDYKVKENCKKRFHLLKKYINNRNYKLDIKSSSELISLMKIPD